MYRILIQALLILAAFSWFMMSVVQPAIVEMKAQANAALIGPMHHIEQLEQLNTDPDAFFNDFAE